MTAPEITLAAMLVFVIVFALVVSAVDVRRSKRGAR